MYRIPACLKFLIVSWEIAVRIFYSLDSRRPSDLCLFSSPLPHGFLVWPLFCFHPALSVSSHDGHKRKTHEKIPTYFCKQVMYLFFWLKACKGSCLAYHQLQKCGCMHYRFPRPPGTKVCDVLNKTEGKIFCYITTCSPFLMIFFQ